MEASMKTASHSDVTLLLAKRESEQHLIGMRDIFKEFRSKPLTVKARDAAKSPPNATIAPNSAIKTVHLVRHGQGFHNLLADRAAASGLQWKQYVASPENPYTAPELTDAPLTEIGRQQALDLRYQQVAGLTKPPELVVLSPLCRAIQTGLLAFGDSLGKVPFLAHEMAREQTGVHFCDMRRSKELQALEFPQVNFELISSNHDDLFQSECRETNREVAERIYRFLEWLALREEEHIAIASHSGWLLTLLNAVVEVEAGHEHIKHWFQTGEMRSCSFIFQNNRSRESEILLHP